jgi:hypothetical protein
MSLKRKLLLINGSQFGYSAAHYYYCKYLREEFEIEFICYDRGLRKINLEGVIIKYVPFRRRKFNRLASFISTYVSESRTFKPDILFVVYFNICCFSALFCKGKVKILDIRTGSLNPNNLKRKIENTWLHIQALFFKKNIILSENLRTLLRLSQNKTLLMPLGSEIYYTGDHNFRDLKLLYIGSLDGRRISDTIEGINIFINRNIQVKSKILYTIIGFGSSKEEQFLKEKILSDDLDSIVHFEGIKSQIEVAAYFKEHNIGIAYLPITNYYQKQPMTKIFEYGLSGMFTIATDTFENRLLLDESTGIICSDNPFSFAEALENCYNNRTKFSSTSIREKFRKFEWESLVTEKLLPFLQ